MVNDLPPYGTLPRGSILPVRLGIYPLEDTLFIIPVAVTIFIFRLLMKKFFFEPIANRQKVTRKYRKKMVENMWFFTYYTSAVLFGCYLIYRFDWLQFTFDFSSVKSTLASFVPNMDPIYGNMVDQIYDEIRYPEFRYFYLVEMAFYLQALFGIVFVDEKGKDFKEMFIHHVVTIVLMLYSLGIYGHRVGFIIFFINDLVDVFLYFCKSCFEAGKTPVANVGFVVFTLVYTLMRMMFFPVMIYYAFTQPWTAEWVTAEGTSVYWLKKDPSVFPLALRFDCLGAFGYCIGPYNMLASLLVVLLIIQIFWYFMVLRVLWDQVTHGRVTHDPRYEEGADARADLQVINNNNNKKKKM
mmetsp:Transcript_300/g.1054  ORF Transcript_300/g.1054 Transcript_300/m.1054 type:complete len:354 (-) Transcript_300:635-1696(-)|eukprot:CAMPEP_0117444542 /NCGR_PEP_ID=MMETSP0759-20121206/5297_1 /TAXON_ID=63605 /ORGANISM="Percolomonas cosmopolitus, Strain WS" /LENGTH=353 /DNA_ID=CAMNT_0005236617 /DNA_START=1775 /DNA_END=2836 /DNA_ORIENTATION=-